MTLFKNKTVLFNRIRLFGSMFFSVILSVQNLTAQTASRNNLISADWLNKNLSNRDLVILDASPSTAYSLNHIPGAISYDIFTYGPGELPAAEIEKRYQSWGISPGKKIVMYDQGGTMLATRLLYSLDYYGFPSQDLYILDGGMAKWKGSGYPVTGVTTPAPRKGTFTINKLNKAIRADLPEFLIASGDTRNNVLVEALEPDWHFGVVNVFGRSGHIPNAVMLPVADFYNSDKTFKSNEELKKIFDYLGINPGQTVYSHCGGGIAASVPFFAIKYLLGYTNVKLFPGSQLEWASDERELPFWTYDAPYLIRDAGWLQGWGGPMMRRFGMSHISLVDARAPGTFHEGHLPYSINIPAVVIRRNISDLNQMLKVQDMAGVNPSDEAVVITGGGLTKEAALAFVMLEKLGQKKISVYMDPSDKWKQLGFTIIKDTIGNSKKDTPKISGPAGSYSANLQSDIIIYDKKNARGLYPRIFISCNKNVLPGTQNVKVVNVSVSDLLNNDGTPKAAKDIWNNLTKAGIPRYAELVCYSDDPGEAAVVYFILKLMGYPDIKVLVE